MKLEIDLFDGHCDALSRCLDTGEGLRENGGQVDLRRGGVFRRWGQFFAIFRDQGEWAGTSLWEQTRAQYALLCHEAEQNASYISLCRNWEEAERAWAAGKCAAFLSVEGAELLECSLERLEEAGRMGVRSVNLTWNYGNLLSGSSAQEPARGLSQLGREFVRRMGRLGMLVDVSHLSDAGFWDVAAEVKGPFWASHSNSRAVFFHPRNLTDVQFTAIMDHHGGVGLNFFPDFLGGRGDEEALLAHLEHFLSLGGEKTVCLGADWDGISRTPEGFSGLQDMPKFYESLLRRGYGEELVRDLFFRNLARVVREGCTMEAPGTFGSA